MEKLIDTIPRDTACKRLREEKERQRLTNQDISDRTGIPLSNIGKFFSCTLALQAYDTLDKKGKKEFWSRIIKRIDISANGEISFDLNFTII